MKTEFFENEEARLEAFPIAKEGPFLAHAGVTALPRCVADAVVDYTRRSCARHQEFGEVLRDVQETRRVCARLIGAHADEIALLGPTSLGLSLFANGIPWREGDEVLCYAADYPANVYPWIELRRRGVSVRYLEPERAGEITPELVERSLGPRTRMVALASCNFLTGHGIDVDAIGKLLRAREVLFSLDAIQTLGAMPVSVEHVDFLSADAHKWLLGPMAIGIVYVKKERFELLRPTLLGAWNVRSPNYIAQDEIVFPETAMRYEPGVLNVSGIYGMRAAIELLLGYGMDRVSARILELRGLLVSRLFEMGCEMLGPVEGGAATGIVTFSHPRVGAQQMFDALEKAGVVGSLRFDGAGRQYVRLSPHFYNTEGECERALEAMGRVL